GAYAVLASICIHYLVKRGKSKLRHPVVLAYTVVMLISATIWFVVGTYLESLEFVGPAGVDPTLFGGGNPQLAILKRTLFVFNIWLADSLITYRLYIIWGSSIAVMVIPCILWLVTVAVSTALLIFTAHPSASIFESHIIQLQTAFYCLSISLNTICTVLITGMLWYRQCDLKRNGFLHSTSPSLAGVIAVIVESAALYSICGIITIPTLVKQLPLQSVMNTLIGSVTCIAPNLIILRLAIGVAEFPTRTKVSTMTFANASSGTDGLSDSDIVNASMSVLVASKSEA
ncbi:hypothetical protein C8T65DRAFT_518499, partial [Cerioporus squamosus]